MWAGHALLQALMQRLEHCWGQTSMRMLLLCRCLLLEVVQLQHCLKLQCSCRATMCQSS